MDFQNSLIEIGKVFFNSFPLGIFSKFLRYLVMPPLRVAVFSVKGLTFLYRIQVYQFRINFGLI